MTVASIVVLFSVELIVTTDLNIRRLTTYNNTRCLTNKPNTVDCLLLKLLEIDGDGACIIDVHRDTVCFNKFKYLPPTQGTFVRNLFCLNSPGNLFVLPPFVH